MHKWWHVLKPLLHMRQVIARLPHLTTLNASTISPYDRKESELRYMRAILGELLRLFKICKCNCTIVIRWIKEGVFCLQQGSCMDYPAILMHRPS